MGIISDLLKTLFGRKPSIPVTRDQPSPSDILPLDAIRIKGQIVTIDTTKCLIPFTKPPKIYLSTIIASKSMDMVFDSEANNLLLKPADTSNHHIMVEWLAEQALQGFGNIAVYDRKVNDLIVHRILSIGYDDEGRYYIFKGDNNDAPDPLRVRGHHIKYICFSVVY